MVVGTLLTLIACGGGQKAVFNSNRKPSKPVVRNTRPPVRPSTNEDSPAEIEDDVRPPITRPTTYKDKVQNYIRTYANVAVDEMNQYGIPASITLAQGILESGAGDGELTRRANNHFGIKCHNWDGERVYHDDDRAQECFRKYSDARYSFRDHSLFLTGRSRYSKLFTLRKTDYKGWARGLKAAGYATDPKYPAKLIGLIERYELDQYDTGSKKKRRPPEDVAEQPTPPVTPVVTESAGPSGPPPAANVRGQYQVKKGDTLYSIAKRHDISVDQLKVFNNLSDNTIEIGQVLIIRR